MDFLHLAHEARRWRREDAVAALCVKGAEGVPTPGNHEVAVDENDRLRIAGHLVSSRSPDRPAPAACAAAMLAQFRCAAAGAGGDRLDAWIAAASTSGVAELLRLAQG